MTVGVDIVEALSSIPTSVLCSAHCDIKPMHGSLVPLFEGATLCGPAKTAKIDPGQNAAIHRAAHTARAGDVLVVEAGGDRSFGPFGELLAICCRERGVRGIVIDCCVRDVDDIRRMRFAVFCLGASPGQTEKTEAGEVDLDIICAGVPVRSGDFVVGDSDGVVVVPQAIAVTAVDSGLQILRQEDDIRRRLANGETTCDIFGLQALKRRTSA